MVEIRAELTIRNSQQAGDPLIENQSQRVGAVNDDLPASTRSSFPKRLQRLEQLESFQDPRNRETFEVGDACAVEDDAPTGRRVLKDLKTRVGLEVRSRWRKQN